MVYQRRARGALEKMSASDFVFMHLRWFFTHLGGDCSDLQDESGGQKSREHERGQDYLKTIPRFNMEVLVLNHRLGRHEASLIILTELEES